MSRNKGQTAFEFVMMAALLIIIGGVFLAGVSDVLAQVTDEQRYLMMFDLGYHLQDEVILATTVQEGYSRTFYIPEKLGSYAYSLSTEATKITIVSGPYTQSFSIPEVSGTMQKGENTITNNGGVSIS